MAVQHPSFRASEPAIASGIGAPALLARLRAWADRRRWLVGLVGVPTLLVALYMYIFAADQFVSESRFMVRSQAPVANTVLGQILGGAAGGSGEDAAGVTSFIGSQEAVRRLGRDVDLVAVWRRNGFDLLNGLKSDPTPEELTKLYMKRVKAGADSNSQGVIKLTVRTFRPDDSRRINELLLEQSEALVNRFSQRAEADALRVSQGEVQRTAAMVADLSNRATAFRDQRQSLDPAKSAAVVTEVIGGLEGQLARAQAELAAQRTYLKPGSPRLQEQQTRVAAISGQLASQRQRLTGGDGSLAPTVAGYERLSVDRDLATKAYGSALASLETARLDAQKQHVYLVRVVEPNLPQKSTYPLRAVTVLGVFGALLLAYGIGWLIVVGVREHAA